MPYINELALKELNLALFTDENGRVLRILKYPEHPNSHPTIILYRLQGLRDG